LSITILINLRRKAMSLGKVMLGFVATVAAGAALGVLFAPAKGSVTRKRIARRGTDYSDDVKEKFNSYIDTISEEYESIKNGVMDLVDKRKEKVVVAPGKNHSK
jgi:gas vesicle protein